MRYIYLFFLLVFSLKSLSQIKISKEKKVDLAQYKTFVVQKGQAVSLLKDKEINENNLFKTMHEVVVIELTRRGYQESTDSTAQLTISYVFEEAYQMDAQKSGPLGQTPITNPAAVDESTPSPTTILRTLIIEIEDAKKHDPLWTATCTLNRLQRDVYTMIDMTTAAAFRKFPKSKK